MHKNSKILFMGEAMLELTLAARQTEQQSFAGDVYNTCVYIKRAFSNNQVEFVTALGNDKLSDAFLEQVQNENVGTDMIGRSTNKHLGAYMVINDATGERSFIYWRNDSAAKQMMTLMPQLSAHFDFSGVGHLFFSGITLAILNEDERAKFWVFVQAAKDQGVSIIFDPNYRPTLWSSADTAKQQFEIAYTLSDMMMPGLDDFEALYGIDSIAGCIDFCRKYDFTELVIKQGQDPVHVVIDKDIQAIEITKSTNVVDTTSAGDAFNGIYIGARLAGQSPKEAVRMANYAAIKVIETKGAIMPKALFEAAISAYK